MIALTIWQPYAWAVSAGLKPIENRNWLPNWRRIKDGDDIAIHAGQHSPSREDFYKVRAALRAMGREKEMLPLSANEFGAHYGRGVILAVATLSGIVRSVDECTELEKPWWIGPYGWRLSNVRQLNLGSAPKCAGQQGLWDLPPSVANLVRGQLEKHHEGHYWRRVG